MVLSQVYLAEDFIYARLAELEAVKGLHAEREVFGEPNVCGGCFNWAGDHYEWPCPTAEAWGEK